MKKVAVMHMKMEQKFVGLKNSISRMVSFE